MSVQRVEPYRRTDRCVNCGRAESVHHPDTLQCPTNDDRRWTSSHFATMNLPPGMTCADCVHLMRPCATIFGRIAADESCDWYPSRFRPKSPCPVHREPTGTEPRLTGRPVKMFFNLLKWWRDNHCSHCVPVKGCNSCRRRLDRQGIPWPYQESNQGTEGGQSDAR